MMMMLVVVRYAYERVVSWNVWSKQCQHLSAVWLVFKQIWQKKNHGK
jgi:hypothetical protein